MRRVSMACANCAAAESENAILRDEIQRLLEELDDIRNQKDEKSAPVAAALPGKPMLVSTASGRSPKSSPSGGSSSSNSNNKRRTASEATATISRVSSIPLESDVAMVPVQQQHKKPPYQHHERVGLGDDAGSAEIVTSGGEAGADSIGGSVILASGSNDGSMRPTRGVGGGGGYHHHGGLEDDGRRDNDHEVGAQTMINYQYFHNQVTDVALQVHDLREQIKTFASGAHHDAQQLIFSALKPAHDEERRQRLANELSVLKDEVIEFKNYMTDLSFQTASQTDCSEKLAIQQLHQAILRLASVCTLARETMNRQDDSDVPTSSNLNWNCEPTLLKAIPYAIQALQHVASNFSSTLDWSRLSLLRMSAMEAKSQRLERELTFLRQGVSDFAIRCFRIKPDTALRTSLTGSVERTFATTAPSGGLSDVAILPAGDESLDQLTEVYQLYDAVFQHQQALSSTSPARSQHPSGSPNGPVRVIVDNNQHRQYLAADAKLNAENALLRKKLVRARFISAARFVVKEISRARCSRVLRFVGSHLSRLRRRRLLDAKRQVEALHHNNSACASSSYSNAVPVVHQQDLALPSSTASPTNVVNLAHSWRSQRSASLATKAALVPIAPAPARGGTGRQQQHGYPTAVSPAPAGNDSGQASSSTFHRPDSSTISFFNPAPPVTFKAFMATMRAKQQTSHVATTSDGTQQVDNGAVIVSSSTAAKQIAANKVVVPQRAEARH